MTIFKDVFETFCVLIKLSTKVASVCNIFLRVLRVKSSTKNFNDCRYMGSSHLRIDLEKVVRKLVRTTSME